MAARTQEDLDLLQEAEAEARARFAPKKKGGRYVASAWPGGPSNTPKVPGAMFGPRRFREDDGLSTKAAPGPKGPSAQELIEEAKRRRAEQRAREREGGR
jgi:hypothetical protein